MCVQLSPRAVAARAPIRSRRPNNSSTRTTITQAEFDQLKAKALA